MKAARDMCDPDRLMRYKDQELSVRERVEVDRHLENCPSCRENLRESQSLSEVFTDSLDDAVRVAPLGEIEQVVLTRIQTRAEKRGIKKEIFRPQRFLLPAAAVAAALVLFFAFFSPFQRALEPSAIINSFTAETSSVMILETPETRQTILWFQEMPGQGGDDEGMQQV